MTKKSVVSNDNEAGRRKPTTPDLSEPSGSSVTKSNALKSSGRSRLSTVQRIELAVQRSQVASLSDDTTLEPELAALYLGISEKKLEELRKPPKSCDTHIFHRLPFLKIFDHGAVGRNQPVQYKLGDLREYQRRIKVSDTFQAAVNAGMAGWVSVKRPFFVQRSPSGSMVILADAWDIHLPKRDEQFLAFIQGKIALRWMSAADAALAIWKDPQLHLVHHLRGKKLCFEHIGAMSSALEKSLTSEI